MGKDYDVQRRALVGQRRTFTLGGIEFTAKPVMDAEAVSDLADLQSGKTDEQLFLVTTGIIRRTLVSECREDFDTLMAADLDEPISFGLLIEIANDLVEDTTGRPTEPPSRSGRTGGSITVPSTGNSASKEEPVSTP